jgi:prepilin-type N-terminal cleavage/methylation domain-containing protein
MVVGVAYRRRAGGVCRSPRGLTFIELMIALAITGFVASILAVLINATAVGTNAGQDGRRGLVRTQAIKAQVGDALANARCILAVSSTAVIYWTGDIPNAPTPANGAVNLSELRVLELDTATGRLNLWSCQWPANFSNTSIVGADQVYAASSNWISAAQSAKGSGYFAATVLANDVSGLSASLDAATPSQARLAHVRIDIADGVSTRSVIVAATLQTPAAPW